MIFLLSMNLWATQPGPADNPDGDWREFKDQQEAKMAAEEKKKEEEEKIKRR